MDNNDIYNMKLHQEIKYDDLNVVVIRVAGGWIYKNTNIVESLTFVPYNNEFQNTKTYNGSYYG